MSNLQHRARARLDAAGDASRWMWDALMRARGDGKGWDAHMFVPSPVVEPLLSDAARTAGAGVLRELSGAGQGGMVRLVEAALMLGVWRLSQGIYRIDPSVLAALVDTPPAVIPPEVLQRLPEWCVYAETPGLMLPAAPGYAAQPLRGVWARHDLTPAGRPMLSVMVDVDLPDPLPVQQIHLRADTVEGCIQEAVDAAPAMGVSRDQAVRDIASWLRPVINVLLYLCAGPEFTHYGQAGEPINPTPIFTKRGLRFFPAQKPQVWDVSVRLGNAIRRAERAEGLIELEGNRGPMRAHIRRAHWHLYWTGARGGERRPLVKWLPPIPVNVDDPDNLPAVIRPVA